MLINSVVSGNRAVIIGIAAIVALAWLQGCTTFRTDTAAVTPASAAQEAEMMLCPFCGGRFAWVGRSKSCDVFECQDCGRQVPYEAMTTIRRMPAFPIRGIMTDTEAVELGKEALRLRPEMNFQQIESALGLDRFAKSSEIATNASGRVEMDYCTDPDVLIVVTGKHRHVAPLILVVIDRWRARLETTGWRAYE